MKQIMFGLNICICACCIVYMIAISIGHIMGEGTYFTRFLTLMVICAYSGGNIKAIIDKD